MATETIRVTPKTYSALKGLSEQSGEPMTVVLQAAVEAYRRKKFMEDVNAAYAKLRDDPEAWADVQAERAEWDCTLADGLKDDPYDCSDL